MSRDKTKFYVDLSLRQRELKKTKAQMITRYTKPKTASTFNVEGICENNWGQEAKAFEQGRAMSRFLYLDPRNNPRRMLLVPISPSFAERN